VEAAVASILLFLIAVYQRTLSRVLVAVFGPICRFEPSCSRYAAACLRDHGAVRGTLLSIRRVSRCHPFHPGGWDPPPPRPPPPSDAGGPTSPATTSSRS
jgi:putative membrane protein insertion efficiency factor